MIQLATDIEELTKTTGNWSCKGRPKMAGKEDRQTCSFGFYFSSSKFTVMCVNVNPRDCSHTKIKQSQDNPDFTM